MSKTRKNLTVGVDERGLGGEREVIKLASTGQPGIIKLMVATLETGVHIDDLQEAMDEIRTFINDRPAQTVTKITASDSQEKVQLEDDSLNLSN